MLLAGKVAVVTGSARGLGKAMAVRLAREGAAVVVNDLNQADMDKTVGEIQGAGGKAVAIKADVTKRAEIRDMVKTTIDKFGKIDIWVNNAGITRHRPTFQDLTDEDWDAVLAVDLKGVFNCIQAVAPHMMERKYGKIINISSAQATGVSAHAGSNYNYGAAKAGVAQMTKAFARELGPHNINVNAIAPGHVPTLMSATSRTKAEMEEHARVRAKQSALGRVGTPEDIANCVAFLASEESSYITAQLISVDGGRTDHI
ncbi:MAG: 3-oxoacyl-ACP reductase family protein [Dehalococcoidales bacterium]|nr:3-oxoacyl-ACP reductase family protein [Dehalococcoidales bacterium]